ncbi:hypothetical protein ACFQFC_23330 [Amorphoplanes digitatis]|uniref:Uncharacterized protein n=1 Tax=Actinoplanes digitatis TaxID=1868 RepID=A0A7W7MUV9_9ACTN|nr:hypothetical protein [Actinoplanes digitatis]MBB4767150.1 hypothetical protein [Actinoplanes digitatis]BFE66771.1 hypothetical protein GCM10020092_000720 [Actinoplanes digitatis]GID95168.1 hypothetical protein Adi01nite_45800 [Actinoplanes digitatis]
MNYLEDERDLEAPEGDAAEQATVADPSADDEADEEPVLPRSAEVSEWDALEQAKIVHLEDEYR